MGWPEIREQIAAILASVEGVGRVHQYQRYRHNWKDIVSLFGFDNESGDTEINAWCITREKIDEPESSDSHDPTYHGFKVRGYLGLQDAVATEHDFQAIIDAIRAAFRVNYQLNNTATHTTPLQVPVIDIRMFGSVLCHYCEITGTAEEWNAWS